MKIDLSKNNLERVGQAAAKFLPGLFVIVFMISFSILSYLALVPQEDVTAKAAGEQKMDDLSINFNTKLLKELSANTPSVGPVTTRNPFAN